MKLTKLNSTKCINIAVKNNINWEIQLASKLQFKTKLFLKLFWENDAVIEEFYIPGSKLRLDLFNTTKKIAIEVSPASTHEKYSPFFDKGNRFNFLKKIKADESKRNWCKVNNIKLAELNDSDIKNLSKELFEEKFEIYL